MDGVTIPKVDKFRYLGSIMQREGNIDDDISQRIKVGWQKWKGASGVLCDKRIPARLKGKVYRMVVRPAVLYGAECWHIKKAQVQRLMVAEMRMVRWMCGYTRLDGLSNGAIRSLVKVATIEDKMREARLCWFGHVSRRGAEAPVRRCEKISIPQGKRGRGRPKKSLEEVIREDLKVRGLSEDWGQDRRIWRDRIKALDI